METWYPNLSLPFSAFFCLFRRKRMKKDEKEGFLSLFLLKKKGQGRD